MNYCGHCGSRLDEHGRCPTCPAAQSPLPRIVEQTASRPPPPPPPPPPAPQPAAGSTPTVIVPAVSPRPAEPDATAAIRAEGPEHGRRGSSVADQPTRILRDVAPVPTQWQVIDEPEGTSLDDPQSWRRSQLATVGVIAAILLLAGLGVVLWNLLADDPDSIATAPSIASTIPADPGTSAAETTVATTLPAPSTTSPPTLPDNPPLTIPPTVVTLVPQTVPATLPPVVVTVPAPETTPAPPPPSAAPATTAAPVTAPPDTVAATTAPPAPPPPPPPASAGGPGTMQVLQDPLPSGMAYGQVRPSHTLSQRLADALAVGDWETARALSPPLADSSDSTLAGGYDGLDRASLMLVDARPEGDGHRLLIVSVANELGGSQTSLYCFEWMALPGAGTVRQGGGVGRIARVPGTVTPEQVRSDGSLDAAVRENCAWS